VFHRAREHDSYDVRIPLKHLREQFRTTHARHSDIGNDDIKFMFLKLLERVFAVGTEGHLPLAAHTVECSLQAVENILFIVYEQYSLGYGPCIAWLDGFIYKQHRLPLFAAEPDPFESANGS